MEAQRSGQEMRMHFLRSVGGMKVGGVEVAQKRMTSAKLWNGDKMQEEDAELEEEKESEDVLNMEEVKKMGMSRKEKK